MNPLWLSHTAFCEIAAKGEIAVARRTSSQIVLERLSLTTSGLPFAMKHERLRMLALSVLGIGCVAGAFAADNPANTLEQTRQELLEAREAAWRAFYSADPAEAIPKSLDEDLIAIQESEEKWDNYTHLLALAKELKKQGVELIRLEFPVTQIQVFGNTAILYYTYIFETGVHGKSSSVDAGRGTEIFVRRDGRWVDVGWHLDNGPFYMKDGHWVKSGTHPAPSKPKQAS